MQTLINEYKLEINNLLCIRKKLLQEQISNEIEITAKLIQQYNLGKIKKVITTAHSAENIDGQVIVDIEIMVEIDKFNINSKALSKVFNYTKKDFRIYEAVGAKHEGDINTLMKTVDKIMNYIAENNLQQITNLYTIYSGSEVETNHQLVECYIGISRNLL